MHRINITIRQKRYGGHLVIRDLSLQIEGGEIVALVGPSGCGKTTLLNLIAGLDRDFEGEIDLGGRFPRTGYVFQTPRLLPWRTVRQNLELVARDRSRIGEFLEIAGLSGFADAFPKALSLGMQRRVAILRAFLFEPELLLMDEPFVSLDPETVVAMQRLLKRLWRERPYPTLLVSHDLPEVLRIADRIVFLARDPCRIVEEVPLKPFPGLRSEEEIEAVIATLPPRWSRWYTARPGSPPATRREEGPP